ncbi:Hypothetical predicted protein [Olea europaea subsp. europaea]|uniref:CLAVATA3/ESR (CLE)-related protein 25-like n=1 Tax=Olea europaea subsp. europaea TaxID=158383 RepID=A0A8S0TPR7_OLEEU|nr:Hypothetical predicted protein [Olea europaea subsp. europaea]
MVGDSPGKVLVVALLAGFLCLTFIGLSNRDAKMVAVPSTTNFKLNSVSKRRVPTGPDPIHNRGTRNSIEPSMQG